MDALLRKNADALWAEVMSNAGLLERRALQRRRDMVYALIDKHFGPAYGRLTRTGGKADV